MNIEYDKDVVIKKLGATIAELHVYVATLEAALEAMAGVSSGHAQVVQSVEHVELPGEQQPA